MALADAKVNSYADLKGKALVTQPKGNTAEMLTEMILKANGLSYQSLSKTNFQAAYTDAVSMMKDGHVQVFTLGTTAPASAVMDLASARDVKLVPVDDKTFDASRSESRHNKLISSRHLSEAGQGRAGDRYSTTSWWRATSRDTAVPDGEGDGGNVDSMAAVVNRSRHQAEGQALDIGVPFHKAASSTKKPARCSSAFGREKPNSAPGRGAEARVALIAIAMSLYHMLPPPSASGGADLRGIICCSP